MAIRTWLTELSYGGKWVMTVSGRRRILGDARRHLSGHAMEEDTVVRPPPPGLSVSNDPCAPAEPGA